MIHLSAVLSEAAATGNTLRKELSELRVWSDHHCNLHNIYSL